MSVTTDGEIVLPSSLSRQLGLRPGDLLEAGVESGGEADSGSTGEPMRIVLRPAKQVQYVATIIDDPISGFPVLDFGPDAPVLTHEEVRAMLVDFP